MGYNKAIARVIIFPLTRTLAILINPSLLLINSTILPKFQACMGTCLFCINTISPISGM
ncbi:unnamed protein product [Meloidogyne enterolobii]|uniref:Uncharacterized protein n=1 Tax=Meloidogyne enterolobii TaxID=390850 RepID=A0ACB0XU36_MELEN